jgi:hypothetical protein
MLANLYPPPRWPGLSCREFLPSLADRSLWALYTGRAIGWIISWLFTTPRGTSFLPTPIVLCFIITARAQRQSETPHPRRKRRTGVALCVHRRQHSDRYLVLRSTASVFVRIVTTSAIQTLACHVLFYTYASMFL